MHNLYREEILEHYHDPLHFGKLTKYDESSKLLNPFCGDEIEMFLKFYPRHLPSGSLRPEPACRQARLDSGSRFRNKFGMTKIEEISFIGKGCAISIAAASMLTDFAKGKKVSELTSYTEEDMLDLLGVEVSETRKKCALLSLSALKDCLKSDVKNQKSKVKSTR